MTVPAPEKVGTRHAANLNLFLKNSRKTIFSLEILL